MAYPATTKTLDTWVADVDKIAANLKNIAQIQTAKSNAGQLNMDDIRRFFDQLVQAANFFDSVKTVPGVADFLKTQKQNAVADPLAEFVEMRKQVIATLDWMRANIPNDSFGGKTYTLGFEFPADNSTPSSSLTFTAPQTAGYRAALGKLISTIG